MERKREREREMVVWRESLRGPDVNGPANPTKNIFRPGAEAEEWPVEPLFPDDSKQHMLGDKQRSHANRFLLDFDCEKKYLGRLWSWFYHSRAFDKLFSNLHWVVMVMDIKYYRNQINALTTNHHYSGSSGDRAVGLLSPLGSPFRLFSCARAAFFPSLPLSSFARVWMEVRIAITPCLFHPPRTFQGLLGWPCMTAWVAQGHSCRVNQNVLGIKNFRVISANRRKVTKWHSQSEFSSQMTYTRWCY